MLCKVEEQYESKMLEEPESEKHILYYFENQRCYQLYKKPEKGVLLYFLIKDRKLENLYKNFLMII